MPSKQRKIAVMGYRSVGKSSLSIQFVEGQFVDSYDPTIENTFVKTTRVNSQDYELKLVDTAGQDEYSIFPSEYSIDVHGYVLVYSITSTKSFDVVKLIYEKLLDITGKGHVPVVLVGNKTDLHMERMIPAEEGKKLAENWKAVFLETSAKQNTALFRKILRPLDFLYPYLFPRKYTVEVENFLDNGFVSAAHAWTLLVNSCTEEDVRQAYQTYTSSLAIFISKKSVSEIFHILLTEIERADGNMNEKSNCSIS